MMMSMMMIGVDQYHDDDDDGDAGVEDKAIEDRRRADRWSAHGSQCRPGFNTAMLLRTLKY